MKDKPTPELTPPEKIREAVAVFLEDFGADIVTIHYENPINHPVERSEAFERLRGAGVSLLLSKLSKLGVVRLADDQTPPELQDKTRYGSYFILDGAYKNAGFRKVETLKGLLVKEG